MTDEERFLFDLQGYLVVKGVLGREELKTLNEIADERLAESENPGEPNWRQSRCSLWAQECVDLIDHETLIPYWIHLLGPYFRLDHDYCIFMRKGAAGGQLHGGTHVTHRAGDHWYKYQDGVMRNGLTVFTYNLADAKEGDGGFACVPGSHKSNFLNKLPGDVRAFRRKTHYVAQPAVEAGDVVIFTEALIHGTMPWTADHQRRGLLYKYSPGHSTWARKPYSLSEFEGYALTDRQKRILEPPSIGSREPVLAAAQA